MQTHQWTHPAHPSFTLQLCAVACSAHGDVEESQRKPASVQRRPTRDGHNNASCHELRSTAGSPRQRNTSKTGVRVFREFHPAAATPGRTTTSTDSERNAKPWTAYFVEGALLDNILSKSTRHSSNATIPRIIVSINASHSSASAAQLQKRCKLNSREMMILYPVPPHSRHAVEHPSFTTPRAWSDSNTSLDKGPTTAAPGFGRKK